ncbi:MAG: hypothetical protein ACI4DU_00255 [Lachnospiraceae bacterium]
MFKSVIQYDGQADITALENAGVEEIELYLEIPKEFLPEQIRSAMEKRELAVKKNKNLAIAGWTVQLMPAHLPAILEWKEDWSGFYLVLDFSKWNDASCEKLEKLLIQNAEEIVKRNLHILVENSCRMEREQYGFGPFSEMKHLVAVCENVARSCALGRENLGLCFHTGRANLLAQNVGAEVTSAGDWLKLVHVQDNNGFRDDEQIPFTFTTGRGMLSTDWYGLIGHLIMMKYDGMLSFAIPGAFATMPPKLHGALAKLLLAMTATWNREYEFEKRLQQPGKQLILFGAGRMMRRYQQMWGEKYPPSFVVDNDSKIWDTAVDGIPVKSPQAILDVPENERNVIVCNMHYKEIGGQLEKMGVQYHCFRDDYYF